MRLHRLVSVTLVGVLLLALVPLVPASAAAAPGWGVTQLTTDAHNHGAPQVSGDRVVWNADDGTNWQVFTQEIGVDPSPIQVTTAANDHPSAQSPQVSGHRIVWQGLDGSDNQIYTRKMGTDASPVLVSVGTEANDDSPQVSGDRVVWYGPIELYTRKMGIDAEAVLLTTMWPSDNSVRVSGDRIVWDASPGTYRRVYTQKIGVNGSPVPLTADTSDNRLPAVSGERVAWEGYDGANWQVFTQVVGTDPSPVPLTSGMPNALSPQVQVSGDRVVWRARVGSYYQIFTQKVGTDLAPVQLTTDAHEHRNPQVSGDRVVWSGHDGANWQIFTQKVGVDLSPVQITSAENDHSSAQSPQVSGDRIVFVGSVGGYDQIFTASPVGNSPPTAVDDFYTTAYNTPLVRDAAHGLFANDTDADGDPLDLSWYSDGATLGTVNRVGQDGSFTYTPPSGFVGTDTFTYQCNDGELDSNWAVVTITVSPVSPPAVTFVPIAGANRYATSVEVSKKAFPDGADWVVIATGENWPDALGGASLAGAAGGPILLTRKTALPSEVVAEIARLKAEKAYILGSTAAVSAGVESALKAMLGASDVTRLGGANRYETARLIAAETVRLIKAKGTYDGTAFVATGANFPDALGASPLAAANGWPIFLVNPASGADAALVSAMKSAGVTKALVLGSTSAVSDGAKNNIASKVPCTTERLAGANRYDTAVAVANHGVLHAGLHWDQLAIATGQNFPDALAGGVLQGKSASVLLLTPSTVLSPSVANTLTLNKATIHEVRFLGGPTAISSAVRSAVANALK